MTQEEKVIDIPLLWYCFGGSAPTHERVTVQLNAYFTADRESFYIKGECSTCKKTFKTHPMKLQNPF